MVVVGIINGVYSVGLYIDGHQGVYWCSDYMLFCVPYEKGEGYLMNEHVWMSTDLLFDGRH